MKVIRSVAMGLATGAALTGCAVNGTPETMAPNGTLEQVVHTLGAKQLGELSTSQVISFATPTGEQVKVFNLTKQHQDEAAFKRTVGFFAMLDRQLAAYPFDANAQRTRGLVSYVLARPAKEHDFVLVPQDAGVPDRVMAGADAVTRYYPKQSQTISVVIQPEDENGQPSAFNTDRGLGTEICQAMVSVLPEQVAEVTDPVGRTVNNRLAQEQVCNSLGLAWQNAVNGQPYEEYATTVAVEPEWRLTIGTSNYPVPCFPLSLQQYATMQQALVG